MSTAAQGTSDAPCDDVTEASAGAAVLAPSSFRLHVVPSYRCNLACGYCYAAAFGAQFPSTLTIEDFSALLTRFVLKGISSVSFLGGEPTLWEPLADAIAAARAAGLGCLLYSNGHQVNGIPDVVILNVTGWLSSGPDAPALQRARHYRDQGARVLLRLNIGEHCQRRYVGDIAQVAREVQAEVSLAALRNSPRDTTYGDLFFGACVDLLAWSIAVRISRPVPLCNFTAYQEAFLRKHCGLSGVCGLPDAVPVLNPDGRTVFPCNSLPVDVGAGYPYDRDLGKEVLRSILAQCDQHLPDECRCCPRRESGECQCGCHGARWRSDVAEDSGGPDVARVSRRKRPCSNCD